MNRVVGVGFQGQEMFAFEIVGGCAIQALQDKCVGERKEFDRLHLDVIVHHPPLRGGDEGFVRVDVQCRVARCQFLAQQVRSDFTRQRTVAGLADQITFFEKGGRVFWGDRCRGTGHDVVPPDFAFGKNNDRASCGLISLR
ncbi:hypothetical protein D3C76_486750 [compost metagenome]